MNKIKSRIFELREIINNHNYHYYDLDKNLISDFQYDELLDELIKLESKYPEFYDENSPSNRVGVVYQINLSLISCFSNVFLG